MNTKNKELACVYACDNNADVLVELSISTNSDERVLWYMCYTHWSIRKDDYINSDRWNLYSHKPV